MLNHEQLALKSADIDFLFDYMISFDKEAKEITMKQWIAKVEDTPVDPLIQIRAKLKSKNYTKNQVMH